MIVRVVIELKNFTNESSNDFFLTKVIIYTGE